jgi:hypothetical protein
VSQTIQVLVGLFLLAKNKFKIAMCFAFFFLEEKPNKLINSVTYPLFLFFLTKNKFKIAMYFAFFF